MNAKITHGQVPVATCAVRPNLDTHSTTLDAQAQTNSGRDSLEHAQAGEGVGAVAYDDRTSLDQARP